MISLLIEDKNLLAVLNDFKGYEKQAGEALSRAIRDTSLGVEKDAKSRLNGLLGSAKHWITGTLAKSIYNRQVEKFEKVVGTNIEYAPYIEFGTGDFVDIPDGAEDVAAKYKGKGLRKVNIKGDSFLNWAAVNQRAKFNDRVIKELNKIKK